MKAVKFVALIALFILSSSCAFDLAHVKYAPAEMVVKEYPESSFMLMDEILIDKSPCNYDRRLRAGTLWQSVGVLHQGTVYRSPDQVVTVKCSHTFEVYLVVNSATLVGVYLPVEDGYIALKRTYPLNISTEEP